MSAFIIALVFASGNQFFTVIDLDNWLEIK